MDEQQGFDQPAQPVRPENDDSGNPTEAAPGGPEKPRAPAGREMLIQLQQMIDTVALQAAPVIREVGAKAAELAAVAGEKAGPLAYKAAGVTEQLGHRVAARSKTMAADLRRSRGEDDRSSDGSTSGADGTPGMSTGADLGEPGTPESGPGESSQNF
jgi:hypothetical protein